MLSNIEYYEALREHVPDEAARLIADRRPEGSELATRADLVTHELATQDGLDRLGSRIAAFEQSTNARFDALEQSTNARFDSFEQTTNARFDALERAMETGFTSIRLELAAELQRTRADVRGWMLSFFVPLWIGVYGTIGAVVVSIVLGGR